MKNAITKKLICLIGDEKIVEVLSGRFSQEGFTLKTANDLPSAELLVHNENPDLVILNIAPSEDYGFKLLESLKKDGIIPKLPVILIVYSKQQEEIDKAFELGVRDYMTRVKFDLDELVTKANFLLDIKKSEKGRKKDGPPTGSVMVVEDDTFLLDLMEKKLKTANIEIHRATDVDQARTILKTIKIDAMLLDMMLPGTNGMTFLKELKADPKLKDIPVIITSNLGQAEEIKHGLEAGAVEYFVKAYTMPGEILESLKKYFPKK